MKKLITALFVAFCLMAVIVPTKQAEAQVTWCGVCCDRDLNGFARPRCVLVNPYPCGGVCVCYGVQGVGFACN